MADTLGRLRELCVTPKEAIRWACVLEATAPKVGNVYPGRSFDDLSYIDFVNAAEIACCQLTVDAQPMSQCILNAVQQTANEVGNNVNLGILLLLGPLVAANCSDLQSWSHAIAFVLGSLDENDGQNIFRAIAAASPGGLGETESNDVRSTTGPVNIIEAMAQATDRDRVAKQYATGFADLIENVVPVVETAISETGDVLTGIGIAHLRLLALEPDSLIARKCGVDFALEVRDRAAQINIDDSAAVERFDQWLRKDGHRRNPGTTADLIAASLYVILRTSK